MSTGIIQIIGKFNYEELRIKINDREVVAKLISEALKKFLEKDAEIILYLPESLVTMIARDIEEAYNYLENPHLLEKALYEKLLESNLLREDFKVRIIKSAGLYLAENSKYKLYFNNNLDNIITYLFLDLLSFENINIIADISTGQNFYVIALLETLRHLLVYRKLEKIFDKEYRQRITLSTITPFTIAQDRKSSLTPSPVNFSELDVKVFFEYPLKTTFENEGKVSVNLGDLIAKDLEENTKRELIQDLIQRFGKEFEKLRGLLYLCRLSYNALKYNAPLSFYEPEIIDLEQYNPEEGLNIMRRILEYIESKSQILVVEEERAIQINRIPISRSPIVNIFLTIALFKSIKENLNNLKTRRNPTLMEFEESFNKFYEHLGLQLNLTFLDREISNIKRAATSLSEGEEKTYNELLEERPGRPQDPKRNFFAHAGLTYDAVLVKREKNEIKVRYREEQYRIIKEYLSSPL